MTGIPIGQKNIIDKGLETTVQACDIQRYHKLLRENERLHYNII